jgi:hypothetical protein
MDASIASPVTKSITDPFVGEGDMDLVTTCKGIFQRFEKEEGSFLNDLSSHLTRTLENYHKDNGFPLRFSFRKEGPNSVTFLSWFLDLRSIENAGLVKPLLRVAYGLHPNWGSSVRESILYLKGMFSNSKELLINNTDSFLKVIRQLSKLSDLTVETLSKILEFLFRSKKRVLKHFRNSQELNLVGRISAIQERALK